MRMLTALLVIAAFCVFSTSPAAAQSAAGSNKCVALTIDDGPSKHTDRALDTLDREGVKATFFLVGENVVAFEKTVERMVVAKHDIGNHTCIHPWLSSMSTEAAKREVQCGDDAIEKATGEKPKFIRAPYGAMPADI